MRIKKICLSDYKRFTKLTITHVPETAKLVVMVGPNGSGKSSVFDAFLLKAKAAVGNYRLSGGTEQYYEKVAEARSTHEIASRVSIDFHNHNGEVNLKTAFQVRSAYRNEADFSNEQVRPSSMEDEGPRLARIIDDDRSVSANYGRMAWNGMQDVYHDASAEQTIGDYRKEFLGDLQDAMQTLFSDPELSLQDFGGVKAGAFRFSKGNVSNFHYKNLSGGEKAAFDILLDVFVKRREAPEAVYCIDEPELHVATGLQGALIAATLKLLPESAQLWVATHSIGIVREAYRMQRDQPSKVVFLDFSGQDFDKPVTIAPSHPTRAFWRNIYNVTLDDLAFLVAPQRVVICEGSKEKLIRAFDADCYNLLFYDESLETLFIPQGGSQQVIQSLDLMAILKVIAGGIEVHRLIDRDDMTDGERDQKLSEGIRVLRRRELEEYLYDSEVLRTFLKSQGCDSVVTEVLQQRDALVNKQSGPPNIKDLSQRLLGIIRSLTGLPNLGNSRTEFALQHLVPALRETQTVYQELREDVFGPL